MIIVKANPDVNNKVLVIHPYFLSAKYLKTDGPGLSDKDILSKRLENIGQYRQGTDDFFKFDLHVFVIHDMDHWFLVIAEISKKKSVIPKRGKFWKERKGGNPKYIIIHVLDSLVNERRKARAIAKVDEIEHFYRNVLRGYWFETSIIRPRPGIPPIVRMIQRNSLDCGPLLLWHLHASLKAFKLKSSLELPRSVEQAGLFYRELISFEPLSTFYFSELGGMISVREQSTGSSDVDFISQFDESIRELMSLFYVLE